MEPPLEAPVVVIPGSTAIKLAPLPIMLVMYAPTPWVKVITAMTAATPMRIPRAVNIERVRLAHRASTDISRLAIKLLPRLRPRPCCWNSFSIFSRGAGRGGAGVGGAAVDKRERFIRGCIERLTQFSPAQSLNYL